MNENTADLDYLTGLLNRRGLYVAFEGMDPSASVHAMYIDIDNFKSVNDIYGHSMGDEVLTAVSKLLKRHENGITVRLGGDEFAMVFPGALSEDTVIEQAAAMLTELKDIDIRKDVLSLISLSIGIVLSQPLSVPLDDILAKCDSAMYISKTGGKNRYTVFHSDDRTLERVRDIESRMEQALSDGEFHIYLQPNMNLITGKVLSAEVFSRWITPSSGVISPRLYIPIFEKNGFVARHDMYIFEETCRLKQKWRTEGNEFMALPVSVNFSRLHLYFADFPEKICDIAKRYDIPTNEIMLEFKERVFINDTEELTAAVTKLQSYGFLVAIDDFGSGVSALNLFKNINVDIIKLDCDFFSESSGNKMGQIVIRNVINLARDLRVGLVAMGVTDEKQIDFLVHCGCQAASGFLFSEPLPVEAFCEFSRGRISQGDVCYSFPLNGSYESEDGALCSVPHGDLHFTDGIFKDQLALSLPGGDVRKAYLEMPKTVLHDDAYTIAFWLKPYDLHLWESAFFIRFEHGFASYNPFAWEGHSAFRSHDNRQVAKWDDNGACRLQEDMWWHIAITYNADTASSIIYVNGMPISTFDDHTPLRYVEEFIFGADDFQNCLHADLCCIRIYDEAKDLDFIQNLHETDIERDDFTGGPLRALV